MSCPFETESGEDSSPQTFAVLVADPDPMSQELIKVLLEGRCNTLFQALSIEQLTQRLAAHQETLQLLILNESLLNSFLTPSFQTTLPPTLTVMVLFQDTPTSPYKLLLQDAFRPAQVIWQSKPLDMPQFFQSLDLLQQDWSPPASQALLPPVAPAETLSWESPSEPAAPQTQQKHHTLLVVDDHDLNVELLSEALQGENRTILTTLSGKNALEIATSTPIDLILLDIMMPQMDGYQVLQQLRQSPETAHISVMLISALDQTQHIVQGFSLGIYDYITKPFQLEEVQARVRSALALKDAQDALRFERDKLDQLFRFSNDGIALLDKDYHCLVTNPAFEHWFEHSETKENENPGVFERLGIQAPGSGFPDLPTRLNPTSLDGISRHFQLQWTPIPSVTPQEAHILLMVRDISEEILIEQRKETFVATLTHDLKTPIRAEIRALRLLQSEHFGPLSETQQAVIQEILYSSQFMHQMVDALLTSYRYEDGQIQLSREYDNLNALIQHGLNAVLANLAQERDQHIQLELAPDLPDIPLDSIELQRVIQNLVQNAIAYTPAGGTITIKSSLSKRLAEHGTFGELPLNTPGVLMQVLDNGRGIEPDVLPYLFDRYFTQGKRFRQVGTGLGLYLCKQVVQAHHGHVWAESQLGQGSCFSVWLPLGWD